MPQVSAPTSTNWNVIDIRPTLFAHSTLRNLDDISGINGSSQLHRPYELKFLNATSLAAIQRYIEWRPRDFIASRAITTFDFLPPFDKKRMEWMNEMIKYYSSFNCSLICTGNSKFCKICDNSIFFSFLLVRIMLLSYLYNTQTHNLREIFNIVPLDKYMLSII